MSAAGFTPIQLYRTTTASAVPSAGNLAAGELAINLTDEALYFKNAAGVVTLLADSSGALGSVTSVAASGGTTGLTFSGSPITTSGTLTLGGTLAVANGGTGVTTSTGTGSVVLSNSPTLATPNLGTPSAVTLTNATGLPLTTGVTGTLPVANGGTGTSTQFTAGSVVFAGASGVYTQDNANLFWDNSNDRLGIGTASPANMLTVQRSALAGNGVVANLNNPYTYGTGVGTAAATLQFTRDPNTAGAAGVMAEIFGGNEVEDTSTNGYLAFGTRNGAPNSTTERMRIDSSGNVGIGTSSPGQKLTVAATTNQLSLTTGTNELIARASSSEVALYTFQALPMSFYTNNTERMRITAAGDVGIGTTSPFTSASFTGLTVGGSKRGLVAVKNAAGADTGYVFAGADNSVNLESAGAGPVAINTVNAQPVTITTNTAERMRITSTGDVGIGTSSPGAKLSVVTNTATAGMEDSFSITNTVDSNVFIRVSGTANGDKKATIGPSTSTALVFNTADTERMRVDSSGRLLVGQASNATGFRVQITGSGGAAGDVSIDSNASYGEIQTFNTKPLYLNRQGNDVILNATSGNVGIGTSSPGQRLTVVSSSTSLAQFTGPEYAQVRHSDGTRAMFTQVFNNEARLFSETSTPLVLGTNNTERMRIDTSGNVGIGTSSPGSRLTVSDPGTGMAFTNAAGGNFNIGLLGGVADASTWVFNRANTPLIFGTNNSERVRIDSSGNVGIGTTGGTYKLELSSASAFVASFSGPTNAFLQVTDGTVTGRMQGQGSLFAMGSSSNHPLTFITNVTERARIDTSGNLLVGTTSVISSAKVSIDSGAGPSIGSKVNATTALGHIIFENPNGVVGQIYTNGSATVYDTASDARLKENVSDADDAASLIDAIQVRKFDWKVDGKHQRYGFVAQELLPVVPEAVSVPADPDDRMGVDYSKLVPMLVKEIQSLRVRVAQLEGN